jgi:type IV pilus assembly protein PilE
MERKLSRQRGVTLIELMIVVVIVAVLASVALPSYRDYVLKSNRAVAKGKLLDIAARQEAFFSDNKQYTATLSNLGIADSGADPDSNWVAASSTDAIYTFSLAVTNSGMSFTATATTANAQTPDDSRCATLTVTNTGQRGATGSLGMDCW